MAVGFVLIGLALAWVLPAGAGPSEKKAKEQMKFGYKAAKRGYWLEALDRFERANGLTPDQPRILNNIAVALEASGRFEEALVTYEEALTLAPNDRVLRRNFAAFQEFYRSQVAIPELEVEEPEDPDGEKKSEDEAGETAEEGEEKADDEKSG
jgi:tetratricopeptide (TPR) repeat protein